MVYRRKNKNGREYPSYWYRFKRSGVQIRVNTKQPNKRAAEELEAAHRTRLAKGEAGIRDSKDVPTLKVFAERFAKTLATTSPKAAKFYARMMKPILRFAPLAEAKLDRIDEGLIQKYVDQRTSGELSRSTVNRELATLRRALRLAQEWRIVDRVPRVRLLAGERVREFVLDRAGESKYIAACPEPLKDLAALILDTGLRLGEALALRWSDVNFDHGRRGYVFVRTGKTKSARRAVSLTDRAAATLNARPRYCEWVFPNDSLEKPVAVTTVDHQHRRVRDALHLSKDFVVHSLRHTMLTRLGEVGADSFTIMKIAGHSSITVSARYVHPSFESMERAIKRLDDQSGAHGGHTDARRKVENRRKSLEVKQMGA